MLTIDLLKEVAALGGYTITGASGADPTNKIRALRRLNNIKADIISRYGGRWPSQYREGWLPLNPLVNDGTVTLTKGSVTVTGVGTKWNSLDVVIPKQTKILLPDGAYYPVSDLQNDTSIILARPYQGPSISGASYQMWVDEYFLPPEAFCIGGFLDYGLESTMNESWPRNMKDSFPKPTNVELPAVYTILGRTLFTWAYSTGTVSGTAGSNILTGTGTLWNTATITPVGYKNIEVGSEIIINGLTYHVREVTNDTQIILYQYLATSFTNQTYVANGKNVLRVRFNSPTSQRIVHYWYYAKPFPLVSDTDEDWICEMYPEVILMGASYKDYLDKNDVARAGFSKQVYENAIKDMKVAEENAMTGVRTVAYNLPPEARD